MFYFKSLVGKHGKYASDDFEKTIPSDYRLDCYRNSSAKSAGIRTNKDFDYKYSELFLLEKKELHNQGLSILLGSTMRFG